MKVVLLGTGGPRPDPSRMGPATLISTGSENIIVDAGRGVTSRLTQAGVSITEFGFIFLTHLHFDHISGLADLLFSSWNKARNKTIHVYGPKGTQRMMNHLFKAYSKDIWYRLSETQLTVEKLVDVRDMVEVHDLEPGTTVDEGDWETTATYVDHGHGLGLTRSDCPA